MPESSKKSNGRKKNKDYKEKPYRHHKKKKRLDKRDKRKMDYKEKKAFYKKSNACHKCGRIGHYARDCKVKDKIKSLDLEDNIKDSLYKILLDSSSENSSPNNSEGEESYTSEDLKALHEEDYMSSPDEECTSCQIGQPCDNKEQDEFYQLYSQFKDLNVNVISNDNWVEMLRMIDDPTIRSQIIDKIGNNNPSTSNTRIPKVSSDHDNTYTMAEVKRQLKLRSQRNHIPTTIQDLVEEINNLKKEISSLKNHNMILDERITYIENKDNNHHGKNIMTEDDTPEGNFPEVPNDSSDNKNFIFKNY